MNHKSVYSLASLLIAFFSGIAVIFVGSSDSESLNKKGTESDVIAGSNMSASEANEAAAAIVDSGKYGKPAGLTQPSTVSVHDFENELFSFLENRDYHNLGWSKDKTIRDTGPYIKGKSYGTHPAVRVYYSPEIIGWLINGRKGTIPDGAVIIKEQYEEPAVQHLQKSPEELRDSLKSWTVMIKDSNGSHDGWFWSNPYPGQDKKVVVKDNHETFDHPESGFGHYCVRCHAATQSPEIESPAVNNEFTFSALRNIEGFKGEPIIFRVDDSWRNKEHHKKSSKTEAISEPGSHPKCTASGESEVCKLKFSQAFADTFDQIEPVHPDDLKRIPPVTHDWVVKGALGKQDLVTSNQCMGCHAGITEPFGPTMFVGYDSEKVGYTDPGWHISPYGEWRWTPMGLAGRDPVFYAQLETEIALLEKQFSPEKAKAISENLQNTCLRCHGAMGKHQFAEDHPGEMFTLEQMYKTAEKDKHIGHNESKYGALGRDGISCMVCHRAVKPEQPDDDDRPYLQYFLETSITGNFKLGPPNEIYGPYKDDEISPYVMHHGVGIEPKYNSYLQDSRMCGTCHAVTLPVIDHPFGDKKPSPHQQELVDAESVPMFKKFYHHIEQATYLEWLNSEYQTEFGDNPNAKSCQECHMSKDLHDDENDIHLETISTRIAAVQDNTYPDAENLTSLHNLEVRLRDKGTFNRHNFVGLNVFLVELFRQHDKVLGVRKNDFMTGSKKDIEHAIKTYQRQAQNDTAELKLSTELVGNELIAAVDIKNKAGHRFPSGVGFRRAFIELVVKEKDRIVWASGRTNSLGIIVGPDDQPLKTEFFERETESGPQLYQPHHQVITSQDQVQIYETLLHDVNHNFTTSFLRGNETIKDNRFLPSGWKVEGPAPDALVNNYLKATHPGRGAKKDARYADGSGTDEVVYKIQLPTGVNSSDVTVSAKLYYQAFPPYFLKNLFDNSPDGEATQRLHFLLNNADVEGSAIEDWKFLIQSAEATCSE